MRITLRVDEIIEKASRYVDFDGYDMDTLKRDLRVRIYRLSHQYELASDLEQGSDDAWLMPTFEHMSRRYAGEVTLAAAVLETVRVPVTVTKLAEVDTWSWIWLVAAYLTDVQDDAWDMAPDELEDMTLDSAVRKFVVECFKVRTDERSHGNPFPSNNEEVERTRIDNSGYIDLDVLHNIYRKGESK